MKKRLLACLMVLCIVVGMLPTTALAIDGEPGELDLPATCTVTEGCTLEADHEVPCEIQPGEQEPSEPVSTQLTGCEGEAHNKDCPLYIAPQGGEGNNLPEPTADELLQVMSADPSIEIDKGSFSDEAEIAVTTETDGGNINVRLDVSYTNPQENPMAGIYYSYKLDGESVEGNAIARAYIQQNGTKKCLKQWTRLQRTHGST